MLKGVATGYWVPAKRHRKAFCAGIRWMVLLILATAWTDSTWSQPQQKIDDIADKSLEELMEIKVTSASKKLEKRSDAPAAIFVITGEDIVRGGFSSIPDALRMVPGLYVAQEDSHSWTVSARGFSSAFNDKMLVLLDGRLLYQPLFGGVYWDTVDPPLEDIDRIEIIRGPGGTLWGANAVNGVINIITKSAHNTKGTAVSTMLNVQSRIDLARHFEFNASYYYNDAISELGVPVLNRADIGFSTRKIAGFTLSIWGRNLQTAHHLENTSSEPYFPAGEIRRTIVFKMMWQSE